MAKTPRQTIEKVLAYHRANVEAGLCQRCRGARGEGGSANYCKRCYARLRREDKERNKRRLQQGYCRRCGSPRAEGDKFYCSTHREQARKYFREAKRRARAAQCR